MTENQARNKVVNVMVGWLGWSEANGKYRNIIDIYNGQTPLPVGYKVKYTDDWCATGVTAAFIEAGMPEIHCLECSCPRMIEKYKKAGRWMELDSYIPKPGDLIMYDWEDNEQGDNTGNPNHVGMVISVSGGTIKVIECNRNEKVDYRLISVNSRYIRGYCLPEFKSKEDIMTEKEIRKIVRDEVEKIQNELAAEPASPWAQEFWDRATALGVVDGSRPRSAVTRQEAATMLLKISDN